MITEQDYIEASIVIQGVIEDARTETRVGEARKFLRLGLRKEFPELESFPELDQISNVQTLESLFDSLFDAIGADTLRAAILSAAKPN